MHKVVLKSTNNKEISFNLPETPSEVLYRLKLDFDENYINILQYITNEDGYDIHTYLQMVCKTVSEFTGTDLNEVLSLDSFPVINKMHEMLSPVVEEDDSEENEYLNKFGELIDIHSAEATLMDIMSHIYSVCNSFEFDPLDSDHSFTYSGVKYTVFKRYVDQIFKQVTYSKVSVGEFIEAFEVARWASKEMAKGGTSVKFTEAIRTVAILARKEGETFPMKDTDLFVDKRAKEFVDLDLESAMGVFFYLTNSLKTYNLENLVSSSLIHLSRTLTQPQTTSEN
jgi:hypothetical protein